MPQKNNFFKLLSYAICCSFLPAYAHASIDHKSAAASSTNPTAQKITGKNICDSEGFLSPKCYKTEYTNIHDFDAWLNRLKINGWLDLDAAKYTHYAPQTPFSSGAILRTARLNFRGYVDKNWRYSFGFAFFNNEASVKQAFLAYTGIPQTEIRIGQMKAPLSLEHLINDRYTTFLESPLPVDILVPEYRLGAGLFHFGNLGNTNHFYTAAAGVYTNKAGDNHANASGSISGITRITYAYEPRKRRVAMAGLGVDFTSPNSEKIMRFDGFPESRVSTNELSKLIHTDDITDVDHSILFDPQGAIMVGPLSFQGEYMHDNINLKSNPALNFTGWYVFASWVITGEERQYDARNAIFTGVEPERSCGAWELTERVSKVDLNSHSILGGIEKDYTSGLNWYVNPSVRFMLNYINAHSDRQGIRSNPNIYTVRGEIDFP